MVLENNLKPQLWRLCTTSIRLSFILKLMFSANIHRFMNLINLRMEVNCEETLGETLGEKSASKIWRSSSSVLLDWFWVRTQYGCLCSSWMMKKSCSFTLEANAQVQAPATCPVSLPKNRNKLQNLSHEQIWPCCSTFLISAGSVDCKVLIDQGADAFHLKNSLCLLNKRQNKVKPNWPGDFDPRGLGFHV